MADVRITIESNLERIAEQINTTLDRLILDDEPFRLAVASSVLAAVAYRIHTQGKKSNGADLGAYSNPYMRERAKNNRTDSRRVVASLTRQMENDFSVVTAGSAVGLGFKNPENSKKAGYIEFMYPETYDLNDAEKDIVVEAANIYIDGLFT